MGQEWLNASTGMPGFIELELVRPFKIKIVRQVVSRLGHKCKHVLLTIQLTSSLFSIVKACHVFLHWLWCRIAYQGCGDGLQIKDIVLV